MNGRLSSWHCDCALQYDCVCLPVAMEEEKMLPISVVGLAELASPTQAFVCSLLTSCTLLDARVFCHLQN